MHKGSAFKIIDVPRRRLSLDETAKKYGLSKLETERIVKYVVSPPSAPASRRAAKAKPR